ncbi:sterol regulatory element-binding protein cleavage-activating protein-like [Clavelina lepadiformis]|uniref:sterol regulatory element-binding protein cleavage-activating protein-like n=1 Tax=Clavelina lepadiformis TaxID=159417 RepID=UPI004043534D
MVIRLYDQVELVFFKYGLFASRHPVTIIFFSSVMVLLSCYPLLNLPLPGSEPTQIFTLTQDMHGRSHKVGEEFPSKLAKDPPEWFSFSNQTAYIQQFLIKSYTERKSADKSEDFRISLSTVFSVISEIKKFSLKSENISIAEDCYFVTDTVIKSKQIIKSLFPQDGCLLLSPAAYWNNHQDVFVKDFNIQQTINQYKGKSIKRTSSVKDLLFGVPSKQSDVSRAKDKQYKGSFAITLVLKRYNPQLIDGLRDHLHNLYSTPSLDRYYHDCAIEIGAGSDKVCANLSQIVTHIYYKPQMRFNDLIPLLSTYFILGCYIYFSVRKINYVKSKIGMAFSAVVSVMASLMMAVGLCSLIGLTPTLNGGEIFPYLVCFIGLENILVITKSVVATPTHMDVEKRIAFGLSHEGCSILKNLLLELVLVGLGYCSLFPEIQEFCAFALVGILSDFFMHMLFFVTVLSIDIRRLDITEPIYSEPEESDTQDVDSYLFKYSKLGKKRRRIRKASEVHVIETGGRRKNYLKIPRRLRLIFFFADTRMIQRGLMVSLLIWFAMIVYSDPMGLLQGTIKHSEHKVQPKLDLDALTMLDRSQDDDSAFDNQEIVWNNRDILSHHFLSFRHWPTLFAYYNITLADKFISVLPTILVPITLKYDDMKNLVRDGSREHNTEGAATAAQIVKENLHFNLPSHFYTGRYQMTGLDYYLTLLLGAVSGMFMVFLLNIMYQCVCSRNYGNSKSTQQSGESCTNYTSSIGDTIPLTLSGHEHLVDCVHVEGVTITSSDISGEVRTWDCHSGECTCVISRTQRFRAKSQIQNSPNSICDNHHDKGSKGWAPSVWSLTCSGQYIIVGCNGGRIEVWDSVSAVLMYTYSNGGSGVVGLASEGGNIVAARLNGNLEFFVLETSSVNLPTQSNVTHRGSGYLHEKLDLPSIVSLHLLHPPKCAHQHPISAFVMRSGRVLTGSCDHTLKLFTVHDAKCQYSMFGHSGSITTLCMDRTAPLGAASGATDGTVRLWDLLTGSCLHKLQGHSGSIIALQCSENHVVSMAFDDKLCIWARRTGLLLQSASLSGVSLNTMKLLGQKQNWCVTGGKGCLFLWDIRNGELLRRVPLLRESVVLPNVEHVDIASDLCVVCALQHELYVVRFPSVLEKN